MSKFIRMLLQVNPNNRPDTDTIINSEYIQKRLINVPVKATYNNNEDQLLSTIMWPKDQLMELNNQLPKPS